MLRLQVRLSQKGNCTYALTERLVTIKKMQSIPPQFRAQHDTALSQLSTGLLLPDAVHRIFEEGQVTTK